MKIWRFITLMLSALSLGMAFCHLMEMPARLKYAPALWSRVTNIEGTYRLFGPPVGASIEGGALSTAVVLSIFVRKHRPVFGYGYGDHGARELTEVDPFGLPQGGYTDSLVAGLLSAERQTFTAEGIEGIALRYGVFYGPGTFSDLFVELMRRRRLAIPRGGGGTISWIHVEDAAAATVAALERGRPGRAYNVVDDEPVNWRDFTWTLAEAFGTPRPLSVPRWVLRLVAPYLAFMMTSTLRVSNAKAKRELLWTPTTPTYREGITQLAQALHERG